MRTIETTAVIAPDHTLTLTVPDDIPPGPCRVVIEVPDPAKPRKRFTEGWTRYDVTLADPNCTFRREDLYGDDGR
jgi:hypothetical protein